MSENKEKKNVFKSFFKAIPEKCTRLGESIRNLDQKGKIIFCTISVLIVVLLIILILSLIIGTRYGNTRGNTNNNGYAVKDGGKVIVSYINTATSKEDSEGYHQSGLYKMETDNKMYAYAKFNEDEQAYSLNRVGSWLYYMKVNKKDGTRSIVRTKKNKEEVLVDKISSYKSNTEYLLDNYQLLQVVDNYIYYINENLNLSRLKVNGKTRVVIRDEISVSDFQISNGYIYIKNTDDELIKVNLNDFEDKKEISEININDFQVEKNYIYYIDKSEKLVRSDLDGKNEETIVDDEVKTFNIVNDTAYYFAEYRSESQDENGVTTVSSGYAIFKKEIKKNETTKIVDAETSYSNINVVGKYIYYNDRIKDDLYYDTIYRVKIDGTDKQDLGEKIESSTVSNSSVVK